jgi:hypothetical protein
MSERGPFYLVRLMPETLAQTLRDWQTFYLLVGGAAAGLVGLTFVAITVGSGSINQQDLTGLRTFINPSLIHFIYVLVTPSVVVMLKKEPPQQ